VEQVAQGIALDFQARAETVTGRPMFRDAFRERRCIIPASGYYEWKPTPIGKQLYCISARDGSPLPFAALWDQWHDPESAQQIRSCTIIVTDANALTRAHPRSHASHPGWCPATGMDCQRVGGARTAEARARRALTTSLHIAPSGGLLNPMQILTFAPRPRETAAPTWVGLCGRILTLFCKLLVVTTQWL